MGFGIIKVVNKQMHFVQMNELLLKKYDDPYIKLKLIFERTLELIDTYHPDEIAIEAPFYGKNVQSMLKLGRAQGVAMAAGLSRQVPITEYMPKKIKMSITGNGNASKEQVAKMLQSVLKLKSLPKNLDSTDGLAAAVCVPGFAAGRTGYRTGRDVFVRPECIRPARSGACVFRAGVCATGSRGVGAAAGSGGPGGGYAVGCGASANGPAVGCP